MIRTIRTIVIRQIYDFFDGSADEICTEDKEHYVNLSKFLYITYAGSSGRACSSIQKKISIFM